MIRPEAARAVRMYLFYSDKVNSEAADQLSDPEYANYEHRQAYYQDIIYEFWPTEMEILTGCGGIDGEASERIGDDMMDSIADGACKGWG